VTYRVVAKDPSGNASAPSNEVTAANLPDTTPPVIGALSLYSISAATARLTWTRATDAFAVRYRVYADGALVSTTPGRLIKLRSLTPATTYTFTVVAVDSSGNTSAVSNAVTATTPAKTDLEPPSVPGVPDIPYSDGCAAILDGALSTDNVDAGTLLAS